MSILETDRAQFFIKTLKLSLENVDIQGALALFVDNEYSEYIRNNPLDVIPIITPYFTFEIENNSNDLFKCCEELINRIAEISSPEETLLQLIEEIEESESDTKFLILLQPMLKVLQRISREPVKSISWGLGSIQTYLSSVSVEDESLEKVLRVEMLYHDVLHLYDILILFYSENLELDYEFQSVILKHLVNLLGAPLAYLNLKSSEEKSRIRKIAEDIIDNAILIIKNPFFFICSDSEKPEDFSYGVFLYLIFGEDLKHEQIPKVFEMSYIFFSSLPYLIELLKDSRKSVIEKGLLTIENILVKKIQLSNQTLQLDSNKDFCEVLESIIIFNEEEEIRNRAFIIFQNYIESFDTKGKYLLFYNLVVRINHSGLASYIVTKYKDTLVSLQKSQNTDLHYFTGIKLYSFLNKCCHITKNDEDNLIDSADKIVAVLNFLRLLVLQDRLENRNDFQKSVEHWRRLYLDKLKTLLEKSKREYMEKKYELEEGKITEYQELQLTVGSQTMPDMPLNEKIQVLEMCLTRLLMIESLLGRLMELLELKM